MTKAGMERIVRVWQQRLGLQAWEIKLVWKADEVCECSEDAEATTWRANDYDRARIYPNANWKHWSQDWANKTLVHELLHLSTRELDRTFCAIDGQLHPDAYRMAEKRYDHEIEGLVERLATQLVAIGGYA